jgi:hypothetical protein
MCECEHSKNIVVEHLYGQSQETCTVKIEKNSKSVNWELKMSGPDFATCIKAIDAANEVMKIKYGSTS